MCTKHCKAIGPPPKAITWDHTRQSIKLGINQANTVVHIHRTGKTDEGNSTCGALFPAVTIAFGIQLARSLSFFSLSLSLSFCGKFPSNNVICWRGYLAITFSDNLAKTIYCRPSHRAISITLERTWKDMSAKWKEHACKWKEHEGKCMQINAKWKEHEVLPKHLKPTKQLLDPFPSLFRNGFWLHVGSRTCWFPQNPGKR